MHRFIEIEGKKIEIDHRLHDPQRPTLVFLHEGLGCTAMWRDFPATVAAATGCNLLVYSRLGYGQSDPAPLPRPVRYMHDEALIMLPAVLDRLGIGQHILVGHSDGGSIALIYAGCVGSPDLLGVITMAPHVFTEAMGLQSISETKVAYETTDLPQKLARYHARVDETFWGWNDIWLHPDFEAWNIEEYLPAIDVPLLVIQGIDDQYGTLAQVEAIVRGAGSIQVETCLLPDCRHSPQRDQPEAVQAAMTTFIEETVRAAAAQAT